MFKRPNKLQRRGAVIIQFALGTVLFFGCVALAVDVGYMMFARGQIQRTVDSAALAGASGLASNEVEERVHQFAGSNNVVTILGLNSNELNITIGNWDGVNRVFIPGDGGPVTPNAVRVKGKRENLDLFFARILGFLKTKVSRKATALMGSGACAGIWGIEGVTVAGDFVTDSYISTEGAYGDGNIYPNGDVCSCQDIVGNGGMSIHGDAMYGDNHEFVGHGNSYEVIGLITEHSCAPPDPDIDWDAASANNDNELVPNLAYQGNPNQGKLKLVSNDHLALPPGTYYFDSASITGQAYISISGPTSIYINGDADLSGGGVVNATQNPHNLTIYAAGPNVKLAGGNGFYGALIAPNAEVTTVGDFNAFGTVLAKSLKLGGNANFHVDEGLVNELFGDHSVAPILVE